jgi:mannose-6-phosphate isomerase-like protein (cupin superfamily)
MKFTLKNAYKVGWDGWSGWAYSSKEDFKQASAIYIEVTKKHGKTMTKESDRVYYVLDGRGEFNINGKEVLVEKSDVIIVPKNTPYDYRRVGKETLKLYLVHVPAFDPRSDVDLEKK